MCQLVFSPDKGEFDNQTHFLHPCDEESKKLHATMVNADGVTGAWEYANSDISGNAITLSLVLDGKTLYSAQLTPGEQLDGITLDEPLAPGSYSAIAVTTVYDANGEQQLTNRVPVTLRVSD